MLGASFALIVNIMIAALFAASFIFVALTNPAGRRALWFAASYMLGMLAPVSLFVIPFSPWPNFFGALNYVGFCAGLFLMTGSLARFYDRGPRWSVVGGLYCAALSSGAMIAEWPQNNLAFNLVYQTPYAFACACSGWIILLASRRGALEIALAGLYGLIAAHFLVKPFFAAAFGVGRTPSEYVASSYAIASQSATGVLLIAAGLLTLLIVAQKAIAEARRAAETDQLTGLLNRRGFDLACASRLASAKAGRDPTTVVLLDLDHFKRVNDRFGHAVGDDVLRYFAALLRLTTPEGALAGRMGGEEFVVFLHGAPLARGRRVAETIRRAAALHVTPRLPPITVSIGVAEIAADETFSHAMRRADEALYRAKTLGRNRVCIARAKRARSIPLPNE
ncbi:MULTISPECIES: GGDEF domain-containing protein [Methylosinus]|uniref:diguanylate cyclase n=1 Tax=Methylosinus trichosporium (strain ATCC 35070 / NCIMB 11131 / UNIQEM 75 / OB3b) TaxID=595536 RepID=A0A2D2D6H4_METT3|nr:MULTISPECIES: GGDEF domain-containing protein [Methylosinus]ATQ70439.1 GGDEF domain-containing protein [Methylosinus trichosporium OB3b]OBS52526.1 diguanylate cyclase [Methylosinus sp. 3S-1]